MQFNQQHMEWILKAEGGFNDIENDKGGATKYGISHRSYPALDISSLTIEDAAEIYRVDYYDAYRLDELPAAVGLFALDGFINHRPKPAAIILQSAVGAKPDGIIGNKTIKTSHAHTEQHTLEKMAAARYRLYFDIVTSDSSQVQFLDGWINRITRLQAFIYSEFNA